MSSNTLIYYTQEVEQIKGQRNQQDLESIKLLIKILIGEFNMFFRLTVRHTVTLLTYPV